MHSFMNEKCNNQWEGEVVVKPNLGKIGCSYARKNLDFKER